MSKLVSNFKEQAKTLSLTLSSTKKQKIVKTIGAFTESTYLLLEAFKKDIRRYSTRDTIPF
jgi:hypothetical protein